MTNPVDNPTDRLMLFVNRVEHLYELSFVKTLREGAGVKLSWTDDSGLRVTETGPSPEQIEAAVLTLRMFLQPRDSISFP